MSTVALNILKWIHSRDEYPMVPSKQLQLIVVPRRKQARQCQGYGTVKPSKKKWLDNSIIVGKRFLMPGDISEHDVLEVKAITIIAFKYK